MLDLINGSNHLLLSFVLCQQMSVLLPLLVAAGQTTGHRSIAVILSVKKV